MKTPAELTEEDIRSVVARANPEEMQQLLMALVYDSESPQRRRAAEIYNRLIETPDPA